jgi:integrase
MSWVDAVGRYCEEVMPHALKPTTAKRYIVSFRAVEPYLQGQYLDSIGKKEIAALVGGRKRPAVIKGKDGKDRKKPGATNATIRRDLTAVSRVLASAIGWGACEHNAALEYDRTLIRERRDPIVLPSEDEVKAAIAMDTSFSRLLALAAQTGMRQSELLGLRWRQVELNRGVITLDRTKTDKPRSIPLSGPMLTEAARTLSGTPRHAVTPLVFWHGDGQPWRNFAANYKAWRDRNNIRFRFHDLRHYFAVMYLRQGGNIYALQRILGHASIKTTEIYLDYLTPEERMQAMHGNGTLSGTEIGGFVPGQAPETTV